MGNSGPPIKAEPIGQVIELSDDEDVKLMPQRKGSKVPDFIAHHGNEQMETPAGEELTSNNR